MSVMDRPSIPSTDSAHSVNRVPRVGLTFFDALDGIEFHRGTVSQPVDLRKDIPHPMRLFLASFEFGDRRLIVLLSFQEAMQVVRFDHYKVSSGRRVMAK